MDRHSCSMFLLLWKLYAGEEKENQNRWWYVLHLKLPSDFHTASCWSIHVHKKNESGKLTNWHFGQNKVVFLSSSDRSDWGNTTLTQLLLFEICYVKNIKLWSRTKTICWYNLLVLACKYTQLGSGYSWRKGWFGLGS